MLYYRDQPRFIAEQNKTPQYVRFTSGARTGAIAKVIDVELQTTRTGMYIRYLTVAWDDRPDGIVIDLRHVEWEEGHTGPTVWSFTRTAREPAYDTTGVKLEVGMLIAGTGKYGFVIGTIREITRANVAVVDTIPTKAGEKIQEGRIKNPEDNCIVLTNDTLDMIMMFKLMYG